MAIIFNPNFLRRLAQATLFPTSCYFRNQVRVKSHTSTGNILILEKAFALIIPMPILDYIFLYAAILCWWRHVSSYNFLDRLQILLLMRMYLHLAFSWTLGYASSCQSRIIISATGLFLSMKILPSTKMYPPLAFSHAWRYLLSQNCIFPPWILDIEDVQYSKVEWKWNFCYIMGNRACPNNKKMRKIS